MDYNDYGGFPRVNYIYTTDDLVENVKGATDAYFDLESQNFLEKYTPIKGSDDLILSPIMNIEYVRGHHQGDNFRRVIQLKKDDLGPFELEGEELRKFLYSVQKMWITYFI